MAPLLLDPAFGHWFAGLTDGEGCSKKGRDYEIWRVAVELAPTIPRGNRWHGPKDWSSMLALKDQLEQVRRYPEELAC